jgi:hypothetical protein
MPAMRKIIEDPEDEAAPPVVTPPPLTTRDPGIASFFGCLVEFPDRAPQGFAGLRLEEWEA